VLSQTSKTRAGAQSIKMTLIDALFESASGFTGTGATVITDLESPELVPRSILFWRSETHFLGGLGILVLFVAIFGRGAEGKALLRAELPGPNQDSDYARVQHAAIAFAGVYLLLNGALTSLLIMQGMSTFDALCQWPRVQ
jgi:trk system potassium uptake protein TrkH